MNYFLPKNYEIKSPSSDKEWESYFETRWKVLRAPWNKIKGSERDEMEENTFHLMIIDGNFDAVACGRLQMNTPEVAQVRYMAVLDQEQGKHLGSILMHGLEVKATTNGASKIFLQAREVAVPFYLNCGYSILEKTFLLYDEIQHYSMEKLLLKEQ